jgi:hypothetical protein
MKKLYLLMAISMFLCGTSMAQMQQLQRETRSFCINNKVETVHSVKMTHHTQKTDPIWKCDFEEGCPEYTFTMGDNTANGWQLITEATYPTTTINAAGTGSMFYPMNFSGHSGWQTEPFQISETPEHWCLFDLITPSRAGTDLSADASINFTNIDLTSCQYPKLTFLQSYRVLNEYGMPMKVSTSLDGGATWTDHVVNNGTYATYEYVDGLVEVLIPEAGGQSNVTIRINVQNNNVYGTSQDQYGQNYGWQVDDIKIIDIPQYNLTINNGRMNFWGYKDYTDPEVLATYSGTMDPAVFFYQYNDPYAQTPRQNWVNAESEWNGYIVFNVELTNNGYATVTPKANIKITSPSGDIIFDRTLAAATSLAMGKTDTIDFYTEDADIFLFDVTSPEQIEVGRYTVTFSVLADNAEDVTPEDNEMQSYFEITDDNYSMVFDEPDGSFGMSQYTSSASGEEIAEYFYYFFLPDDEINVDVFINQNSSPDSTSFKIVMYEFNEDGDMRPFAMSSQIVTTEDMLGNWTTIRFQDPCYIDAFDTNYASKSILVGLISYYDTPNSKLYYGTTNKLPAFHHNVITRSANAEDFESYGYSPVALRIHKKNESAVESVSMANANMYPNPTSGIVNFTNVENATIEIFNMMGQVVASVESATENTTIDLSGIANGNYIVRVAKNGNVATSKLNIVK